MSSHSFAICAYGESPYLEECIKSVKSQSSYSEAYIATSTPNEHIEKLANRYNLPLYINYGETGIAGDWNFAVSQADTDYVTITHQDDIYLKDYAKEVKKALDAQKNPIIAFTDYCEVRDGKKVSDIKILKIKRLMLLPLRSKLLQRSRWIRRRILSFGSAICCPSVCFVKKNMPEPLFLQHYKVSIDWETWERLSRKKGSFVYCPKILMGHRIHEDSETTACIAANLRTKEDYEMFCKFWPKFIARILSRQYRKSEDSNKVKD